VSKITQQDFNLWKTRWSRTTRALNPETAPQTAPAAPQGALKPEKRPLPQKRGKSALSALFEELWAAANGPALETEVKFHPVRRWRFDYAIPARKIAIELEGIVYQSQGGHQSKKGYEQNTEKYLEATLLGWQLYRLCRKQLTPETVARIVAFLAGLK
jgi:very-short-patch-repair endonuclease